MASISEKLCCLNTSVLEPSLNKPDDAPKIIRAWDDVIKETQLSRSVPPSSGRIKPLKSPADPSTTVSLAELSANKPLLNLGVTSDTTSLPQTSSFPSIEKQQKPPEDLNELDLPLTVIELEKLGVSPSILNRYKDLDVPYLEGTPDNKIYRVHWLWVQIIKRPLPEVDVNARRTRYRAVL